nr:MAG: ORF1 [TTV-like mini virus]
MPWRYYNRYRTYRRRRPWFRRPRRTFRRRRYRRQWVRRKPFYYRKKLKKLILTEYQPKSIRNCKCKGFLCLLQTGIQRLTNNFDMYEESYIPDRLPGGGGFSIKNLSLQSLYIEHTMGHNIFTKTNQHYPLMRYKGCKIKFYQSEDTDYVCTYSTTWPLKSSMLMYNSMQPSIHLQQKHKIIVPSKKTLKRKRPYISKYIPPPTQMENKWYFQHNLAKTPLFMLRTSACSLDNYYIGTRMLSTNMTIVTLNTSIIQNREFGNRDVTYSCRTLGTVKYFLYASHDTSETPSQISVANITMLINTQDYTPGQNYYETKKTTSIKKTDWETYYKTKSNYGNPFYSEYLLRHVTILISTCSPTQLDTYVKQQTNSTDKDVKLPTADYSWEIIDLTRDLRYNPYKDNGTHNSCYFLHVGASAGQGWANTGRQDIENFNLPLWLLLFGFADFIKHTAILKRVDTDYILVISTNKLDSQLPAIVPISETFEYGASPYIPIEEVNTPNPVDRKNWFPQFQYQQECINNICLAGPGTAKIPKGTTAEAKIKYTFYFKWGGELPPMSTMDDPTEKPVYPIPNNIIAPTSFQNPTELPETFLYSFDERRGQLTQKAAERITKDWQTKDMPLFSTGPRFSEETTPQETQTTSSQEEEEENLYELLQQQRAKQQQLRIRIMKTLQRLQQLE